MKNSLVSIIIPTYNRTEDLQFCLNSVLEQDCRDFEIIVVDDCSDDDTEKMIKNFFAKVKYIKKKKRTGVSQSKNIGIRQSKGKYLWFLDSDSKVLRNDVLSNLVKILEKNPSIGSIGGEIIEIFNEKYLRIFTLFRNDYRVKLSNIKPDDFELKEVDYLPTCNCFVRRELLYKIGGFEEEYFYGGEDVELSKRIRDLGFKNVIDFRTLVLHRRSNISRTANYKMFHINKMRLTIRNFGFTQFLTIPFLEAWNFFDGYKGIRDSSIENIKGVSQEEKKIFSYKIFLGLNYLFYFVYAYIWNIIFLPKTLRSKYRPKNYLS